VDGIKTKETEKSKRLPYRAAQRTPTRACSGQKESSYFKPVEASSVEESREESVERIPEALQLHDADNKHLQRQLMPAPCSPTVAKVRATHEHQIAVIPQTAVSIMLRSGPWSLSSGPLTGRPRLGAAGSSSQASGAQCARPHRAEALTGA
jgi:hypothetical protein